MISDSRHNSLKKKISNHILSYSPGSSSLSSDFAFLTVLGFLQLTVLQVSAIHPIVVDLMTPAIALLSVTNPLKRALPLSIFAALLLETHTAVPFGLYFCSYWVITVTISLVKAHISWRQVSSWVYVVLSVQGFTLINTALTQHLTANSLAFNLNSIIVYVFQLCFALLLLQLTPRSWLYGDFSERGSW